MRPPATSAPNGSFVQRSSGSALTTSTWPLRTSERAAALADRPDERAPAFVGHQRDAAVRPLGQPLGIRHHRLARQSRGPKPSLDEPLRGLLLAEEAADADEVGEEADRVVEAVLDRAARVR